MKRGYSLYLPVKFTNINVSEISEIEFIFKTQKSSRAQTIKINRYLSDGSGDVYLRPGTCIFDVPWNEQETYSISPNTTVYMDTKVHVVGSSNCPETPIISFMMHETLFEEQVYE